MAEKFVLMEKDGEQIEVNALAVDNHKQLGWVVVDENAAAAEVVEDAPDSAKSKPSSKSK